MKGQSYISTLMDAAFGGDEILNPLTILLTFSDLVFVANRDERYFTQMAPSRRLLYTIPE